MGAVDDLLNRPQQTEQQQVKQAVAIQQPSSGSAVDDFNAQPEAIRIEKADKGVTGFIKTTANEGLLGINDTLIQPATGWAMMFGMDVEEAKQHVNNEYIKAANMGVEAYNKEYAAYPWTFGTSTRMIPGIVASGFARYAGASLGAAGGAMAVAAGQAGPQAFLPEELITVPSMTALGATVGSFSQGFIQGTGNMYYDARTQLGMEHKDALPIAAASGLLNGVVSVIGWGAAEGAMRNGFKAILSTPMGKQWLIKQVAAVAPSLTVLGLDLSVGTIIDPLLKLAVRFVDPEVRKVYGHKEFWQELQNAAIMIAQGGPILAALGFSGRLGVHGAANKVAATLRLQNELIAEGVAKHQAANKEQLMQRQLELTARLNNAKTYIEGKRLKKQQNKEEQAGANIPDDTADLPPAERIQANQQALDTAKKKAGKYELAIEHLENNPSGDAQFDAQELKIRKDNLKQARIEANVARRRIRQAQYDHINEQIDEIVNAADHVVDQSEKDLRAEKEAAKKEYINARGKEFDAKIAKEEAERLHDKLEKKANAIFRTAFGKDLEGMHPSERKPIEDALNKAKQVAYEAGISENVTAETVRSWKERLGEVQAEIDAMQKSPERIKRNQKLIEGFITKSGLSKEGQADFIEAIAKTQSNKELARVADGYTNKNGEKIPGVRQRIAKRIDAEHHAELTKSIDQALSNVDAKRQSSGVKKSKYYGSQEELDAVKRFWNNEEAAAQAAKKHDENLANGTIDPIAETEAKIANMLFGKKKEEMSFSDLENILRTVNELKDDGEARRLVQVEETVKRQESNAEKFLQRLRPAAKKPATTQNDKSLARTFNQYRLDNSSWEGVQQALTGNDNFDILDPFKNYADERANVHSWLDHADEVLRKYTAGIDENDVRRHIIEGDEEMNFGTDADGNKLVMTRNQAIQLLLHINDAELKPRLKEGGVVIPTASGREIRFKVTFEEDMPPNLKGSSGEAILRQKLNDGISDKIVDSTHEIYGDYFDRVDQYSFEKTGRHLEHNPKYGGTADGEGTRQEFFEGLYRRATARPGHIIERVENSKPIRLEAWNEKLAGHINQTEHAIAFSQFESDAPALLQNKEVKQAIINYGGVRLYDMMVQHVKDIVVGRYDAYHAQKLTFNSMRKNAFKFYLGGDPVRYAKQLTSLFAANLYLDETRHGPKAFQDGVIDYLLNRQQAVDVMNQSAVLRERAGLMDRDYQPSIGADLKRRLMSPDPTIDDVMSVFTVMGDRHAIEAGFWAVYRAELKATGDPQAAMLAFERAFNSTQSSGTADQMGAMFRAPDTSSDTLFAQQPTRMSEHVITAIQHYRDNPTPENKRAAMKAVLVANACEVMYESIAPRVAVRTLAGDPTAGVSYLSKVASAGVFGPFRGAGWGGSVIQSLTAAVAGEKSTGKGSSIKADVATDIFKGLSKGGKLISGNLTARDIFQLGRLITKYVALTSDPKSKTASRALLVDTPLKFIDDILPR